MKKGKFIVIEGPDGSGKTVTTRMFADLLKQNVGQDKVVVTREIGGTPIAESVRGMMLTSGKDEVVSDLSRLLMAYLARNQHLTNVVVPALESGQHVVCDRFNLSTRVYQGTVDGMNPIMDALEHTGALGMLSCGPNYLIYLKVDGNIAYNRGVARKNLDNDVYKNNYERAMVIHRAYDGYAMAGYQEGEDYHHYSLDYLTKVLVVDATNAQTQEQGIVKALRYILQDV